MSQANTCTIKKLPNELLDAILSHLSVFHLDEQGMITLGDRGYSRAVCKVGSAHALGLTDSGGTAVSRLA
jgi:hypothetical protein